jgi:hypothetical protein
MNCSCGHGQVQHAYGDAGCLASTGPDLVCPCLRFAPAASLPWPEADPHLVHELLSQDQPEQRLVGVRFVTTKERP